MLVVDSADAAQRDESRVERQSAFAVEAGGVQATNSADEPIGIIYFVGIIDILQPYNAVKRVEHYWKSIRNDRFVFVSVSVCAADVAGASQHERVVDRAARVRAALHRLYRLADRLERHRH